MVPVMTVNNGTGMTSNMYILTLGDHFIDPADGFVCGRTPRLVIREETRNGRTVSIFDIRDESVWKWIAEMINDTDGSIHAALWPERH